MNLPPKSRSLFLLVFIRVFLVVMIVSTAITFLLPEKYAGTVKIGFPNHGSYGGAFIDVPLVALFIQSGILLSNVVEHLDLNTRWGKEYYDGKVLTTGESVSMLRRNLAVAPDLHNPHSGSGFASPIVEITAYSPDRAEAAELANAVAEAYQDYRSNKNKQLLMAGLRAMTGEYRENEKKIAQLAQDLAGLKLKINVAGVAIDLPEASLAELAVGKKIDEQLTKAGLEGETKSPADPDDLKNSRYFAGVAMTDRERALAMALDFHHQLGGKILEEISNLHFSKETLVQIIEPAVTSNVPVKPDKPWCLVMGGVAGVLLGLLAGITVTRIRGSR